MKLYRFDRQGMLAIEPRALFQSLPEPPPRRPNRELDLCVVVDICGPLDHHDGSGCFDSYEAIGKRFDAALESQKPTIVLCIDSPGGLVSGCFELARSLRGKASAKQKKLVTYVNGEACSAAYALACAGEQICVPETGTVGSIGVINTRLDLTAQDRAMGAAIATITSGARKSDGNPHVAMTDAELAESQASVNALAAVFFRFVADMRGTSPEAIEALQARTVFGSQAVSSGLADRVVSFDGLLALLAGPERGFAMATMVEARAALEGLAKGEGDDADIARRALVAMDSKPDPEGDGDGEPAGDPPAGDEKKKKDDEEKATKAAAQAAGARASASTSTELAQTVQSLSQRFAALEETRENELRTQLFAQRPDLSKELVSVLRTKSYAEAQAIVAAIPKAVRSTVDLAASGTPQATRGADQGGPQTSENHAMDVAMGLRPYASGIKREGNTMLFGAMTREEAAKHVVGGAK